MNSGAFVMLIIRLAWSQYGVGEPIESLQKHWIIWAVWKLLQGCVITQPSFQFTDHLFYDHELPRNTRVSLCFETTNVGVGGWSFRKPHENPDSRIPFRRYESANCRAPISSDLRLIVYVCDLERAQARIREII